jgi:hypothetical protein
VVRRAAISSRSSAPQGTVIGLSPCDRGGRVDGDRQRDRVGGCGGGRRKRGSRAQRAAGSGIFGLGTITSIAVLGGAATATVFGIKRPPRTRAHQDSRPRRPTSL